MSAVWRWTRINCSRFRVTAGFALIRISRASRARSSATRASSSRPSATRDVGGRCVSIQAEAAGKRTRVGLVLAAALSTSCARSKAASASAGRPASARADSHVAEVPGQLMADLGVLGIRPEQRLAQVASPACTPAAPPRGGRLHPGPRPGRRRGPAVGLEILGPRVGPRPRPRGSTAPLDRFQHLGCRAMARREGHPIEHLGTGPLAPEPAVGGIGLGQRAKEIPRSSHRRECVIVTARHP